MITIYYHIDTVAIVLTDETSDKYSSPSMTVYTEFEAVLKATSWVQKENE